MGGTARRDPTVLPALSSFVGRSAELEALRAAFDDYEARLVTVVGAPGVGKSRLVAEHAARSARAFERGGGVLRWDLSAAEGLEDALWRLARGLGATSHEPAELGDALLRRGRALLVVDDAEPLAAELATPLGILCRGAPLLRTLVASREPLRVDGETVIRLPPLGLEAAGTESDRPSEGASLFLARARAASGLEARSPRERALAERVATLLEGLPLALELAAARTNVLGLEELAARLEEGFGLLTRSRRDGPSRHESLEAAVRASFRLLGEAERAALSQCALFRGGFDLAAAEAVVRVDGAEGETLELLASLVDRSLVSASAGGGRRLRLIEPIRRLAEEDAPASLEAAARHGEHYLEAARSWLAIARAERVGEALRWLELEGDNLMAVASRALVACGPGRTEEAAGPECLLQGAAEALVALDAASPGRGGSPAHAALVAEALDAARHGGLEQGLLARLFLSQARSLRCLGESAAAREALDRAVELARDATDRAVLGHALAELALARCRSGELEAAREAAEAAVGEAGASSDLRCLAVATGALAVVAFASGGRAEAARRMEEARRLGRRIGDAALEAEALGVLGNWAQAAGDLAGARRSYEGALAAFRACGETALEGVFLGYLATVSHEEADLEAAARLYGEALALLCAAPAARHEALFRAALGAALAGLGARDAALETLDRAMELARPFGEPALSLARELHAAQVDLLDARTALAAGRSVEASVAAARARAVLARAQASEASTDDDVVVAGRLLAAALGTIEAESGEPEALLVGPSGAWFRSPGAARVDLGRRKALAALLARLAEGRRDAPGVALDTAILADAGWPGEALAPEVARHRVRVAAWTLRRLGLRGAVQTRGSGYLLDPRVPLRLATDDAAETRPGDRGPRASALPGR